MNEKRSVWQNINSEEFDKINNYSEEYKQFLNNAKTEREATTEIIRVAKENGFLSLEEVLDKGPEKMIKSILTTKINQLFLWS